MLCGKIFLKKAKREQKLKVYKERMSLVGRLFTPAHCVFFGLLVVS